MDMQSFRREALDLVARRSMDVLREFNPSHLRQLAMATFLPKPSPIVPIAAAIGGLVVGAAIGAGVAVFATPVSGPVLRKKVVTEGKRARARAMELSEDATRAVQEQATRASTALGITSPVRAKRVANGHSKRSTTRSHHASH
jgi:gas vesicle protein